MTKDEQTAAEQVAAGVAFMHRVDPGWWRTDIDRPINLDDLNIDKVDNCILAQRCPLENYDRDYPRYYWHAALLIDTGPYEEMRINNWAEPLGFYVNGRNSDPSAMITAVTAEWKRVITELREQAAIAAGGTR